jgi:hypothetical protein
MGLHSEAFGLRGIGNQGLVVVADSAHPALTRVLILMLGPPDLW